MGLLTLQWGKLIGRDALGKMNWHFDLKKKRAEAIFLFILLAINALFLHFFMLRSFQPHDYSGFMDAAWRVFRGQKIYQDFFFHAGPVWPYTLASFYFLFGFGITAFLAHLLCISSAAILITYLTVRNRISFIPMLLVMLSVTSGFYWNYPFPHYTHDAVFWGMPGLLILFRLTPFKNRRQAFYCGLCCGIFGVVSYMTKCVIGIPYGFVYMAILLLSGYRRFSLQGLLLGTLITLGGIALILGGYQAYLYDTRLYLTTVTERFSRFIDPRFYLYNFYWPVMAIVGLNAYSFLKKLRHTLVFFFGSAFIALISLITGSVGMLSNNGMLGICAGFGFMILQEIKALPINPFQKKLLKVSYPLLFSILLMQIVYTTAFCTGQALQWFKNPKDTLPFSHHQLHAYVLQAKPLKGWHCPRDFGTSIDPAIAKINAYVPPQDSLLCLSPWEILYALTGRDSYKKVPFQMVPGALPVPGENLDAVRRQIIQNPPDWIMTHYYPAFPISVLNKYTIYLDLNEFIQANYHIEVLSGVNILLHKNSPGK